MVQDIVLKAGNSKVNKTNHSFLDKIHSSVQRFLQEKTIHIFVWINVLPLIKKTKQQLNFLYRGDS